MKYGSWLVRNLSIYLLPRQLALIKSLEKFWIITVLIIYLFIYLFKLNNQITLSVK